MKRTLVLTTPHIKADDVKYAQRLLTKNGYYDGKVDGEFGPLTAQALPTGRSIGLVTRRQRQTFGTVLEKFLLGKTQPAADAKKRIAERKKVAATKPLREKALAKMERFVGLTENPSGSNNVPEINGWWGGNVAWCARTVSKAYIESGSKAFSRGRNYQHYLTIVADARAARNGLTVTLNPKPGDLVCYDWDGSNFRSGNNHIGMFKSGPAQTLRRSKATWTLVAIDISARPRPR